MNDIWSTRYGTHVLVRQLSWMLTLSQPTPMTEAQLFPLAPMNAAREAFKGILYAIEGAIEKRLENALDSTASHNEDIAKLNVIVQELRNELGKLPPLALRSFSV